MLARRREGRAESGVGEQRRTMSVRMMEDGERARVSMVCEGG